MKCFQISNSFKIIAKFGNILVNNNKSRFTFDVLFLRAFYIYAFTKRIVYTYRVPTVLYLMVYVRYALFKGGNNIYNDDDDGPTLLNFSRVSYGVVGHSTV